MNKKMILGMIVGTMAILSMVVLAQGYIGFYGDKTGMMASNGFNHQEMHSKMAGMHEAMETVMEQGEYSNLVEFREKIGFNMMPWVTNEETFNQAREMHSNMEKMHEGSGNGMNGMMGMHQRSGVMGNGMGGMCR